MEEWEGSLGYDLLLDRFRDSSNQSSYRQDRGQDEALLESEMAIIRM